MLYRHDFFLVTFTQIGSLWKTLMSTCSASFRFFHYMELALSVPCVPLFLQSFAIL